MNYPNPNDLWRAMLLGEMPHLKEFRWLVRRLPREPRCPLCLAPFRGVGGWAMRLIGRGPATMNPKFCDFCERAALTEPGGAEIDLTMLVADVRGSTHMAEKLGTTEYTDLMKRFFDVATDAVMAADGLVDKYVGDAIVALFVPGFAGPGHVDRALEAANGILRKTGNVPGETPWLPVGVGVHAGRAYVGVVGPGRGAPDVTAMGEAMNLTARLADEAASGELVVTAATQDRARDLRAGAIRRTVRLDGISDPVEINVHRP